MVQLSGFTHMFCCFATVVHLLSPLCRCSGTGTEHDAVDVRVCSHGLRPICNMAPTGIYMFDSVGTIVRGVYRTLVAVLSVHLSTDVSVTMQSGGVQQNIPLLSQP